MSSKRNSKGCAVNALAPAFEAAATPWLTIRQAASAREGQQDAQKVYSGL